MILLMILCACWATFAPGNVRKAKLLVSADGSGDFRTVQAAVDSVPPDNRERVTILLKPGIYHEQVRIQNSFLKFQGEDRDSTRIVAAVDTSACRVAAGESKEEKCATIIADGTDLVFENLTVVNSFRKTEAGKGAALSFVGNSSHIVLSNVTVEGFGGDTLVLSARRWQIGNGGEYYLHNVSVSGTYHLIVPRGTTYATGCKFWCLGGVKNCLFNEGITRESDKFVVRNSSIDGPEPFGLGSYFRDAAWYFIDDRFSGKLRPDGNIFRDPAKDYTMKWGERRIYFAGNQAPNYPWLQDNLQSSPAKSKDTITAAWTFGDWDPENGAAPKIVRVDREAGEMVVEFDQSVTVEGRPEIRLASGAKIAYSGGSGTSTLAFKGNQKGTPVELVLDGGTIYASEASLHIRIANLRFPIHAQ